jgi:hypothetical protein
VALLYVQDVAKAMLSTATPPKLRHSDIHRGDSHD